MGYPQANQQTQFLGYPQNQLYNQADQQYMLNTQRQFADWGPWRPGMTNVSQWDTGPGATNVAPVRQQMLNDYYQRVGNPYEQSQRQGYWEQMGGQTYGGVIPPRDNPLDPVALQAYNRQANTPWGDLNNMGISSAYGMPAWQQDYFNSQNQGQGVGSQAPIEQFNLQNSGSTSMSNYGIPSNFAPAEDYTRQQLLNDAATQSPNWGGPNQQTPQDPMAPAAPEWMYPQQQNAWGNQSSNPWSHSGGWGGRGWGR